MMDVKERIFPRLVFNILWINFLVHPHTCLRLTNMTAPAVQDPRQDMQLYCRFDMGGEDLYAVKWYKDDHEFFRFSPGCQEKYPACILQFPVAGVHVNREKTHCTRDGCDLLLTNLSRPLSSGAYRCEVSSEAPAFRLASQTHNVSVAALPDERPILEGLSDNYVMGTYLLANCSSGFGDPKPILTWYVNKEEVSSKLIREFPSKFITNYPGDKLKLRNTITQMKLHLDKKMLKNQASITVEISCVSSIEGLNPSVAPPLKASRRVQIVDQQQIINNEKLHWSDAAASKATSKLLVIGSVILIGLVKC